MHLSATVPIAILDIGRSLRLAFFMFWQTLWALVLGFSLSGAAQAFVSRAEMERLLGNHRPAAVVRAAGLGMASSSCSYAASALARSLFARGADFLSAVVFMVASTNLVVELGIVLVILLGWPFLAGEAVGGPVMIVLVVLLGTALVPAGMVAFARRKAEADSHLSRAEAQTTVPWRQRLRSRERWDEASGHAWMELRMVRRELLVGYLVAGVLATVVPVSVWHDAFLHGAGGWADLENAVVGPIIAFASSVCSIGNVPLAAALWHGGVAFGGVVSFVFADLLAAPLVLLYRRYYGGRLTARLVVLLWTAMVGAGLVVQVLFSWAGIIPTTRPARIVPLTIRLDATTVLDLLAVAVVGALWWQRPRRQRPGADSTTEPACHAPAERP
jgi:uncharacterized protein